MFPKLFPKLPKFLYAFIYVEREREWGVMKGVKEMIKKNLLSLQSTFVITKNPVFAFLSFP